MTLAPGGFAKEMYGEGIPNRGNAAQSNVMWLNDKSEETFPNISSTNILAIPH